MGSRYLFIVLYVFLESHLARGDYVRPGLSGASSRGVRGWRRSPGSLRAVTEPMPDKQGVQQGVADDVDAD